MKTDIWQKLNCAHYTFVKAEKNAVLRSNMLPTKTIKVNA